jgi:hypothetical protein
MAEMQHSPNPEPSAPAADAPAQKSLSRFEGHCPCRRTRECEELLQLAVLGVERAREGHRADHDLVAIAEHLSQAERHVEIAPSGFEMERLISCSLFATTPIRR